MNAILRTVLLMSLLTAVFVGTGYLIAGPRGMVTALLLAGAVNLFAWWGSDRLALAAYGARPADPAAMPELQRTIRELATRAGLPIPRLYVIDAPQPNAFATGRSPARGAVAVTTGLLERLPPDEVAAVVAHELAHIRNRDTLIMTVTATIAGALGTLTSLAFYTGRGRERRTGIVGRKRRRDSPIRPLTMLLALVLAPLAATLVRFAISRTREYEADRLGATISGNPSALASALARLQTAALETPFQKAESSQATAHLFIINPLRGRLLDGLFSTHPPVSERVRRLQEMIPAATRFAEMEDRYGPAPTPVTPPETVRPRGPWG